MNIEQELLWAMLPEGLEEWFEVERYEKTDKVFRIYLIEKNVVPKLPEEYRGRRVVNTYLKSITIDDLPIRGRKGELIIKRRMWKLEGVERLLKRDIILCAEGTKLEKEFADFLKESG